MTTCPFQAKARHRHAGSEVVALAESEPFWDRIKATRLLGVGIGFCAGGEPATHPAHQPDQPYAKNPNNKQQCVPHPTPSELSKRVYGGLTG